MEVQCHSDTSLQWSASYRQVLASKIVRAHDSEDYNSRPSVVFCSKRRNGRPYPCMRTKQPIDFANLQYSIRVLCNMRYAVLQTALRVLLISGNDVYTYHCRLHCEYQYYI